MAGIRFSVRGSTGAIMRDLKRVHAIQRAATVSALNTTAVRKVEGPAVREIAQAARVTASRVRWRYDAEGRKTDKRRLSLLKARRTDRVPEVSIWFGRRHFIPAITLGKARQTRRGVTAGKHQFSDAFIGRANGANNRQVFKRRGPGRYPLELMGVPMLPEGARIMTRYVHAAGPHFRAEFDRLMRARLRRR